MPHKFDTRQKDRLLADQRYEALQPDALLRRLGLRRGDTVADIGCGPGFFTLPAAHIVGSDGVVIAADVQGEMLTTVRTRAAADGLTNVFVRKTSDVSVPLPERSCDFVLVAFTLNEVDRRAPFLHRLAQLLKPNGQLVVMEWQRPEDSADTGDGPPLDTRITPEELEADAAAAGLVQDRSEKLDEQRYLSIFRRATGATHAP